MLAASRVRSNPPARRANQRRICLLTEDFFQNRLASVPVVAILRGLEPSATVDLARRCWDAGIELVEVPIQDARGLAALEATAHAAQECGREVGAGTVYRVADAVRAKDAGARYLVAPGLDLETVAWCRESGLPYLPGVVSPTEIQVALSQGLRSMKLFPAGAAGVEWLKAMLGPFPQAKFVAVGGVHAHNAAEFLDAGAVAVGVGGALGTEGTIEQLASLAAPAHMTSAT